jgi:hypothetical protein
VNKTILITAAALCIGLAALPAAAEKKNQPSAAETNVDSGQLNPNMIQTPFRFLASGNYVFVINGGTADWTGPLDVTIKCVPVAPATSCGANFAGGALHKHYNKGEFPKGHGQTPVSAPNGNSVIISQGGGYDAVFMGLQIGSYKITASAANNTSPEMPTTVTVPPPGSPAPIHLNPAATQGVRPKN